MRNSKKSKGSEQRVYIELAILKEIIVTIKASGMAIRDRLYKAIELQKIISFDYEKKRRVVEPYHYGILGGKEQLHCYQTQGNSNSGNIPQWRNFQLSHMRHLRVDDTAYFDIREDYNPGNSHYTTIEKSVDQTVRRPFI